MKEGWDYKKLGEVSYYPNKRIPLSELAAQNYVGVETLVKDRGGIAFSKELPNAETAIEFHKDDILIGNIRPYLKKIWLSDRHGGASGDVVIVRVSEDYKNSLDPSYLYKVLSSDAFFDYDNLNTHGAKMPRGDRKAIAEFTIPLPTLDIQQSIVAEIDLINELIRLKKEQLFDYDELAKSIFYEMFGDPEENEKGWEIDTIGNCFPYIKNGANIKQSKDAAGIPITRIETLSGGVFNRHRLGYANIFDSTKYRDNILESDDLLMSHINSKTYIGRTVKYTRLNDETIIHGMNLLRLKGNSRILSTVFAYYTSTSKFTTDIARIRKDAVNQSSFAISDLKKVELYIPPLSLQLEFAKRIDAIEQQKSHVKEAIEELETLLASRMQYWFD